VSATVYLINDLEQLTGIKAHTLRIWEKRFKVVHPKRTPKTSDITTMRICENYLIFPCLTDVATKYRALQIWIMKN
jgi:abortive infection bacteriophage resistance protein